MVCVTKYFQSASAVAIWLEVVMTSWSVALPISGLKVVNFAVASRSRAFLSGTSKLGSPLGGRARKTPDVFSLPGTTARF